MYKIHNFLLQAPLGIWAATQAQAPTWNQTIDTSVRGLALNLPSHTSQGEVCSSIRNVQLNK